MLLCFNYLFHRVSGVSCSNDWKILVESYLSKKDKSYLQPKDQVVSNSKMPKYCQFTPALLGIKQFMSFF